MSAEIIHGDCLDVLRETRSASVDAVICDPPYGINTKSDGSGKLNPWADLTNAAFWYREWIGECRRVLKPTGCLWSCLNWRSLVTFQKASCDLGWPITSLLVWDKEWIGPGGSQGLRPSYELVALWSMPDFAIVNRGLPVVQRFKWSGHKPHDHPAEKPVTLMRWLIEQSNARSVLDPFAGSGTVGEACLALGVNYVGVETDERWAAAAALRLREYESQQTLTLDPAA
jgi:site-specific DNA-methyltransferase (adenine-specific)